MPVAKDKYRTTHRIAYTCTSVVHKDRSLDRFIVGRQFLVVLIIFLVNICGGFVAKGGPILGLPDTLLSIFLENGLAMMFITLNVGQLAAQLNSAGRMLDFINNRVMWVTMWLSFFVESSGGLHVIYLVQLAFPPPKESSPPAEAPSPVVSDAESPLNSAVEPAASHSSIEPSTDGVFFKKFGYAARVLLSLLFLCFAMVTSGAALTAGWTTMWTGVAPHSSACCSSSSWCMWATWRGCRLRCSQL